ncbi:MAG: hypothetical protein K0R63_852 [Rickettsiales bacterium]|jgi:hypothetical protein|nr:hypothetical protein [Rickettsiales bacterium]
MPTEPIDNDLHEDREINIFLQNTLRALRSGKEVNEQFIATFSDLCTNADMPIPGFAQTCTGAWRMKGAVTLEELSHDEYPILKSIQRTLSDQASNIFDKLVGGKEDELSHVQKLHLEQTRNRIFENDRAFIRGN